MDPIFDAGNERLPARKLFTLGLQHVLFMYAVMYAGVIAVHQFVGPVLGLTAKSDAHNTAVAAEGGH